jgi:hypothetical protein
MSQDYKQRDPEIVHVMFSVNMRAGFVERNPRDRGPKFYCTAARLDRNDDSCMSLPIRSTVSTFYIAEGKS